MKITDEGSTKTHSRALSGWMNGLDPTEKASPPRAPWVLKTNHKICQKKVNWKSVRSPRRPSVGEKFHIVCASAYTFETKGMPVCTCKLEGVRLPSRLCPRPRLAGHPQSHNCLQGEFTILYTMLQKHAVSDIPHKMLTIPALHRCQCFFKSPPRRMVFLISLTGMDTNALIVSFPFSSQSFRIQPVKT